MIDKTCVERAVSGDVSQVYKIVNEVYKQMSGREGLKAIDDASLVAIGKDLEDTGRLDLWLKTLNVRIGLTIDGWRVYRSKFSVVARNQMEWGAIVQKINVRMPDAVEDESVKVGEMDGQAIDQWVIRNPKADVEYFDNVTPYSFFVTIQERWLKEAFLSAGAMAGFIAQVFGKIQNKIEATHENLARATVGNYILNTGDAQVYPLVTMYNAWFNKTLTTQEALFDNGFLRYMVGFINSMSDDMETMSVLYNKKGYDRFTDKSYQNLYLLSFVLQQVRTQVAYSAFNKDEIMAKPDIVVPYWQAATAVRNLNDFTTISSVSGTTAAGEKTVNNIIGVLFDYEALGTFRDEQIVRTTPSNARGLYYNTFWHERQMWFNDLTENFVVFTLN